MVWCFFKLDGLVSSVIIVMDNVVDEVFDVIVNVLVYVQEFDGVEMKI